MYEGTPDQGLEQPALQSQGIYIVRSPLRQPASLPVFSRASAPASGGAATGAGSLRGQQGLCLRRCWLCADGAWLGAGEGATGGGKLHAAAQLHVKTRESWSSASAGRRALSWQPRARTDPPKSSTFPLHTELRLQLKLMLPAGA